MQIGENTCLGLLVFCCCCFEQPDTTETLSGGGEIGNAYLSRIVLRLMSQQFDLANCEQLQRIKHLPVGTEAET